MVRLDTLILVLLVRLIQLPSIRGPAIISIRLQDPIDGKLVVVEHVGQLVLLYIVDEVQPDNVNSMFLGDTVTTGYANLPREQALGLLNDLLLNRLLMEVVSKFLRIEDSIDLRKFTGTNCFHG